MDKLKEEFPKSAFSFYLKLYCKRKVETKTKHHELLEEATQSWISLNKSEKQMIKKKYNDYLNNCKKNIGEYLKNAEPYLKLKPNIRIREQKSAGKETDANLEIDNNKSKIPSDLDIEDDNERIVNDESNNETRLEADGSQHNPMDVSSPKTVTPKFPETHFTSIPEPTPPTLLTGKELFTMINEREQSDVTWESLTKLQKDKYQKAVLAIKRKYLNEYKLYLEHLPPEKLYKHYKDAVKSV